MGACCPSGSHSGDTAGRSLLSSSPHGFYERTTRTIRAPIWTSPSTSFMAACSSPGTSKRQLTSRCILVLAGTSGRSSRHGRTGSAAWWESASSPPQWELLLSVLFMRLRGACFPLPWAWHPRLYSRFSDLLSSLQELPRETQVRCSFSPWGCGSLCVPGNSKNGQLGSQPLSLWLLRFSLNT